MSAKILGISGSPIKNSNTDRAIKAILEASGKESEFVKLSDLHIRPCLACKRCVKDNLCKQEDNFPELAKKVLLADALVIGAYCPYSNIDAFTKAFLERLWSMRHVNNLNEGKLVVIVVSGIAPERVIKALKYPFIKKRIKRLLPLFKVGRSISREMRMENMKVLGTISIRGNVPCLTCGEGTTCKMSGVPPIFGKGIIASSKLCTRVEDQVDVWNEILRLGRVLNEKLS
ncbi:MAG: flavodoxin family protein [archaeon]|nr:flavodoxin family protein [archaeon]